MAGETEDPRTGALIAAAWELLDAEGLEGVTIRAVLARTGLARRAFYDRFGTKDDLMLAVFESSLRDAAGYFAELVAAQPDPLARLKLIVEGIALGRANVSQDENWESSRRSAALSREHLRLAEARPFELQRAVEPLVALIAAQLEAGIVAGVVRKADPRSLATLVYNLLSTTMHTELLAEEASAPDRQRRALLAEEIWQFCARAIAA
jgi:AcrR family transcriptional regulator